MFQIRVAVLYAALVFVHADLVEDHEKSESRTADLPQTINIEKELPIVIKKSAENVDDLIPAESFWRRFFSSSPSGYYVRKWWPSTSSWNARRWFRV